MNYPIDVLPQAIVFDMDGTLVDSERLQLQCFMETTGKYGFDAREELYLQCIGATGAVARKGVRHAGSAPGLFTNHCVSSVASVVDDRRPDFLTEKSSIEPFHKIASQVNYIRPTNYSTTCNRREINGAPSSPPKD